MISENKINYSSNTPVNNLTAFWAFSEGFLGGILNALKIPFKGLLLGNISVTIIIFIAGLTNKKGAILKAGIITTIVKAIVSPYSSIPAYFAVIIQTLLGELFFLGRKFKLLSGIMLGIITSLISSVQRVIILTLIFGNAFWDTIDRFSAYIYNEFFGGNVIPDDFNFSSLLIGIYMTIHVIAGFLTGLYATKLSIKTIANNSSASELIDEINKENLLKSKEELTSSHKKKSRSLKFTEFILYLFLITVLVLSYVLNNKEGISYFESNSVWIMLVRSVIIMVLWFKFLGPFLRFLIRSGLLKNRNKYSGEIQYTLSIFPFIKQLIFFAWKKSEGKGLKKISGFTGIFLPVILQYEKPEV